MRWWTRAQLTAEMGLTIYEKKVWNKMVHTFSLNYIVLSAAVCLMGRKHKMPSVEAPRQGSTRHECDGHIWNVSLPDVWGLGDTGNQCITTESGSLRNRHKTSKQERQSTEGNKKLTVTTSCLKWFYKAKFQTFEKE